MLIIFYAPLKDLLVLSFHNNELYSHIILIPFISGYFIYIRRKKHLHRYELCLSPWHYINNYRGVVLYLISKQQGAQLNQNGYLSLMTFAAVIS